MVERQVVITRLHDSVMSVDRVSCLVLLPYQLTLHTLLSCCNQSGAARSRDDCNSLPLLALELDSDAGARVTS